MRGHADPADAAVAGGGAVSAHVAGRGGDDAARVLSAEIDRVAAAGQEQQREYREPLHGARIRATSAACGPSGKSRA